MTISLTFKRVCSNKSVEHTRLLFTYFAINGTNYKIYIPHINRNKINIQGQAPDLQPTSILETV